METEAIKTTQALPGLEDLISMLTKPEQHTAPDLDGLICYHRVITTG